MTVNDPEDLLKQGVAAVNEGRKAEARRLLTQVLEQDERNEMAWLWMSGAVDTDAERRICLENVLKINPNNGIAKRGLERLGVSQSVSPFTTMVPLMSSAEGGATSDGQAEPGVSDAVERTEEGERAQAPLPQQPTGRRPGWINALVVGLLVFVCFGIVGIWWTVDRGLVSLGPRPTMAPTVSIVQTPTTADADSTPVPGATLPPTWTPRPTDTPAAPLPTRTPRPTDTPRPTWTPTLTPTATLTGTLAPTPTPALTLPPTWTPHPTGTSAPGFTPPPTWTPQPTKTSAPGLTLPPTWTPHPTNTPAAGLTLPPTWTPPPTSTPAPGLTLPPTWTPQATSTPTVTPTLVLTGTLPAATPGG